MKRKILFLLLTFVTVAACYGSYKFYSKPYGNTVESREEILAESSHGIKWNIANEQSFNDFLLCTVYSEDKSGIAVFEKSAGENYKILSNEWRNSDEIILSGILIEEKWYNLIWFNGTETDYAEIIYTINGENKEPIIIDVNDMKLICSEAPGKDYDISVRYFGSDGKIYEL